MLPLEHRRHCPIPANKKYIIITQKVGISVHIIVLVVDPCFSARLLHHCKLLEIASSLSPFPAFNVTFKERDHISKKVASASSFW